jgi:hypothetical protein
MYRSRLISLWMNILWYRGVALIGSTSRCLPVLKQLQTCLDVNVGWVEVCRALIGVKRVGSLVVTRLVLFVG